MYMKATIKKVKHVQDNSNGHVVQTMTTETMKLVIFVI